ncbi:MAG TPA: hypothetical protein VGY56_02530 [Verrucomicrobiae bacterium]|nr:hypothetical protein [Verrucomicrobiae bacterium]
MKKVETTLTFAELAKMASADLFKQAAFAVKVSKAVETAKDRFDETLQFSAKVVAAMKRRYQAQINAREIPPDTSFKKYFEQNAGGVCPARIEALAALFNALVLTVDKNGKPLLAEEIFDEAAVDWLEKANAIIKAAQKEHGENWKGCDDVLDTINALSKPGNAAKKLNEIRKRQKGESKSSDGDSVTMTPELAAEYVIAAIKKAGEMPADKAANLFKLTFAIGDTWAESGVDTDTLNQWSENIRRGVAPEMEVITEPQAVAA